MSSETEATLANVGDEPTAGGRLGRYIVIGRLGAGTTGQVLVAYDPELDRKVALKLLRPGAASTDLGPDRERRRLEAMQALARLSDPHVVAVHDVGLHEGRVFVAMELVDGRTLAAWLAAAPRSWRSVLEVMMQAGRGLAAAHAHGIAHGDFELHDVTIADDGRVRVMDLGLARAVDEPSGDAGRSDGAAADQLAFCTCLHEALRADDSAARARVPRWLWRVVERGLAADASQRWSSMPALLDALERGGARAQLRRGLAMLAIVGSVGAGAWGWQRHAEAASVRACEAEGASIEAVWSADVSAAVHDALAGTGAPNAAATAERLQPWLEAQARGWQAARTQACIHARVSGDWDADSYERSQWCLDERRMELEALVGALRDGDARILDRAVPIASSLRSVAPCLDPAALARLSTPPADQREVVRELRAELSQATVLQHAGAFDQGLAVADEALAGARALGWPPLIAAVSRRVGVLEDAKGKYADAEARLEDAYFEAIRAEAPDVAADAAASLVYVVGVTLARHAEGLEWARHHDLLLAGLSDPAGWRRTTVLADVASIHRAVGANAEAEARLREVLEIRERELGPEHPVLAATLNNLANVLQGTGAVAPAKALLERALSLQERTLGPDHPAVAITLTNLGNLHQATGRSDTARAMFERALVLQERTMGPAHANVAVTLGNLGNLLQEQGELEPALALQERALAIRSAAFGSDHPAVVASLQNLASVHRDRGEHASARARLEQALAGQERMLGTEHPELVLTLASLAEEVLEQGSATEAAALAGRALRLHEGSDPRPGQDARVRFVLARASWDAGQDRARAVKLAEQARASLLGPSDAQARAEVERWLAAHAEQRP